MLLQRRCLDILALAAMLSTGGCAAGALDESEQDSEVSEVGEETATTEQGVCTQKFDAYAPSCKTKAQLKSEANGWCVLLALGGPSYCRTYSGYCGTVKGTAYCHHVKFNCY